VNTVMNLLVPKEGGVFFWQAEWQSAFQISYTME
jgi:hypothetical protein